MNFTLEEKIGSGVITSGVIVIIIAFILMATGVDYWYIGLIVGCVIALIGIQIYAA